MNLRNLRNVFDGFFHLPSNKSTIKLLATYMLKFTNLRIWYIGLAYSLSKAYNIILQSTYYRVQVVLKNASQINGCCNASLLTCDATFLDEVVRLKR